MILKVFMEETRVMMADLSLMDEMSRASYEKKKQLIN
jgi:hypothetical protein